MIDAIKNSKFQNSYLSIKLNHRFQLCTSSAFRLCSTIKKSPKSSQNCRNLFIYFAPLPNFPIGIVYDVVMTMIVVVCGRFHTVNNYIGLSDNAKWREKKRRSQLNCAPTDNFDDVNVANENETENEWKEEEEEKTWTANNEWQQQ